MAEETQNERNERYQRLRGLFKDSDLDTTIKAFSNSVKKKSKAERIRERKAFLKKQDKTFER